MVDQPGDPSTLFGAVRRLFEAVARRKPLVIIIEDLHWAQPTFLDLLENLAASTHQPLVLLCLARPEFRGQHELGTGARRRVSVPLAPLDPGDSERLLTSRRFGRALPSEAVTRWSRRPRATRCSWSSCSRHSATTSSCASRRPCRRC